MSAATQREPGLARPGFVYGWQRSIKPIRLGSCGYT